MQIKGTLDITAQQRRTILAFLRQFIPGVAELKEALDESNLPFIVDLHVWDEIPEGFHKIIRERYRILQKTRNAS